MSVYFTPQGARRTSGAPLGEAGASGSVWRVREQPRMAMKLWSSPTPQDVTRLRLQLSVRIPTVAPELQATIAWPLEELRDARGNVVGFTMLAAAGQDPRKLFTLMTRTARDELADNLRFDVLMAIAASVCGVAGHLHQHRVTIGDVNELNVLASCDGLLTWIDADSMQFTGPDGAQHPSPYYRDEYLAPEFAGLDLGAVPRTIQSDDYAVAVLTFQLLLDGFHPFDAVERTGIPAGSQTERAARGLFAYGENLSTLAPPPGAPPWEAVPIAVQHALRQTFVQGTARPSRRTTAWELHYALKLGMRELVSCSGPAGTSTPSCAHAAPGATTSARMACTAVGRRRHRSCHDRSLAAGRREGPTARAAQPASRRLSRCSPAPA